MENRIAGVWVKASPDNLPKTFSSDLIWRFIDKSYTGVGYGRNGFFYRSGWLYDYTKHEIEWLDESQPIPVNQEITEAIIEELNYLIEDGESAMDNGETGDEIKYSINDFRYDCERRIKYWQEQLKSNPEPVPVQEGLREDEKDK